MRPFVNTDVEMPAEMFDALDLFECECVGKNVKEVSVSDVTSYLLENYGPELSKQFEPRFLY
jgi:hypothetical protein